MDKSRLEFLLNGIDTEYSPNEDTTVQYLKRRCSEEEYSIVVLPRSGFTFEKKNKEMIFSCKLNSDNVVIHSETGKYVVGFFRLFCRGLMFVQYYLIGNRSSSRVLMLKMPSVKSGGHMFEITIY